MGMNIRLFTLGKNIRLMWKINLLSDSNYNGNARFWENTINIYELSHKDTDKTAKITSDAGSKKSQVQAPSTNLSAQLEYQSEPKTRNKVS